MDHESITLLLIARGYTTSWEQTSLHYREAYLSAMLASQLASNSPLEYTLYHTPNIRIQPTLEHLSSINTSNTPYLVVVIIH